MEECTAKCPKADHDPFLPTRLLDVDGIEQGEIKLVVTESLNDTSIQYAALSYCWGNEEEANRQLKTSDSTIRQRLQGIPRDTLTKVMQDAVTVCRSLSLRYLWIDSLCIIQDQKPHNASCATDAGTDWEHQSQMMGDIFSNAYVTICAANSSSCHESFLERSLIRTDLDLAFVNENEQSDVNRTLTLVQCTPALANNESIDDRPLAMDLHGSRWLDRAWVFQERHMSPRMLIFGATMVHFRCGWLSMAENGYHQQHVHPQTLSGLLTNWSLDQPPHEDSKSKVKKTLALQKEFRVLIREYRTTSLTYPSDRLPAISGLISLVSKAVGDASSQGLWKESLYYDLLWKTPPPSSLRFSHVLAQRSSLDNKNPSWSWLCEENQNRGYFGVQRFKVNSLGLQPEYQESKILDSLDDDQYRPDTAINPIRRNILRIVARAKPLRSDDWGKTEYSHSTIGELHTKRNGSSSYVAHCDFDFVFQEVHGGAELRDLCSDALLLCIASERDKGNTLVSIPGHNEHRDFLQKPVTLGRDEGLPRESLRLLDHNAWGLIIYPVPQTDKYIRIGTFFALCYGNIKGARIFEGFEYRTYDIV